MQPIESTSPLDFEYCILTWYTNSRNQFPSSSDKNPIDLVALRIDCTWDHAYLFAIKVLFYPHNVGGEYRLPIAGTGIFVKRRFS
jgi:hypothetical protein